MKQKLLILFIPLSLLFCVAWTTYEVKPPPISTINGRVYEIRTGCYDADSVYYQQDPVPMANCTLVVRAYGTTGLVKIQQTFVTDDSGRFTLKLRLWQTETLYYYELFKTKPYRVPKNTKSTQWDTACYRQEYNTADFSHAQQKGETKNIDFTIFRNCEGKSTCATRPQKP